MAVTGQTPEYLDLDQREFRCAAEERAHTINAGVFRDDISPQEVADFYNNWSDTYDSVTFERGNYFGPIVAAEGLHSQYMEQDRPTIKVLDIGCGTGLVGRELYKRNFRIIDGLDPSAVSLEKAAEKRIYGRLICDRIAEHQTDIEDSGIICVAFRKEYLEAKQYRGGKFDTFVDELEVKGKWQKIVKETVPDYAYGLDGVRYIYRVLPKD